MMTVRRKRLAWESWMWKHLLWLPPERMLDCHTDAAVENEAALNYI